MFNFITFCEDYNIPHYISGKNAQPGWVQVQCVFCGDNSDHLGFNMKKGYFNCWRCGWHSLYNFLEKTTNENPNFIIKKYSISKIIQNKLTTKQKKIEKKTDRYNLTIPGKKLTSAHKIYLSSRNFNASYLEKKYDLRGTGNLGKYKFRIIIPIYHKKRIVSFQTRDITEKQELKYVSCPKIDEIVLHKTILYNLDNCKEDYIIVVEGVFDVWRLGDNCACTFGTGYRPEQLKILKNYKKIYIIFDNEPEAQKKAIDMALQLDSMGVNVFNILLDKGEDPADMSEKKASNLLKKILLL